MAESGALLKRCRVKSSTGGSNPPLSAIFQLFAESRIDASVFTGNLPPLFLMGKQYNKVIKRKRARAYELRAKERVQQATAESKKRK